MVMVVVAGQSAGVSKCQIGGMKWLVDGGSE